MSFKERQKIAYKKKQVIFREMRYLKGNLRGCLLRLLKRIKNKTIKKVNLFTKIRYRASILLLKMVTKLKVLSIDLMISIQRNKFIKESISVILYKDHQAVSSLSLRIRARQLRKKFF